MTYRDQFEDFLRSGDFPAGDPPKDGGSVIPVSFEFMVDSGHDPNGIYQAMLDEMHAESRARFDALPWRTRFMRRQIRPRWYTVQWRLAHAARALRGIECERDD